MGKVAYVTEPVNNRRQSGVQILSLSARLLLLFPFPHSSTTFVKKEEKVL